MAYNTTITKIPKIWELEKKVESATPMGPLTRRGGAAKKGSTHYTERGKRPRLLTVLAAVTIDTVTVTVQLLLQN